MLTQDGMLVINPVHNKVQLVQAETGYEDGRRRLAEELQKTAKAEQRCLTCIGDGSRTMGGAGQITRTDDHGVRHAGFNVTKRERRQESGEAKSSAFDVFFPLFCPRPHSFRPLHADTSSSISTAFGHVC